MFEETWSPWIFFQLSFTDAVWNLIVEQTNLYAEQKREPGECSMSGTRKSQQQMAEESCQPVLSDLFL